VLWPQFPQEKVKMTAAVWNFFTSTMRGRPRPFGIRALLPLDALLLQRPVAFVRVATAATARRRLCACSTWGSRSMEPDQSGPGCAAGTTPLLLVSCYKVEQGLASCLVEGIRQSLLGSALY
jgi:hypothetical protein